MAIPFVRDTPRNNELIGRFKPDDLVFSDEFLKGTSWDVDKWRPTYRVETNPGTKGGEYQYQSNLNQHSSNRGIGADGTPNPEEYTEGKRFGLHYDKHREKVHRIVNGRMGFGAFVSTERDLTIPDFNPDNPSQRLHPYFDDRYGRDVDTRYKVYGSWLDSAGIARVQGVNDYQPFIDPTSPRHAWRYGYYEIDMDLRDMVTPDFRGSDWLMPYCDPEVDPEAYAITPLEYDDNGQLIGGGISVAGDNIAVTGCEIDLQEYAPSKGAMQTLLMKVPLVDARVNGVKAWGQRNVEANEWGYIGSDGIPRIFDLRKGLVTIGLWWNPNGLSYLVNGIETNRDLSRVPKIAQFLNLTREATECNGVGKGGPSIVEPYRKSTVTGWLYGENAFAYTDRMPNDVHWRSYVRVWQDKSLDGSGQDSNWRDPNNIANAIDPSTPEGDVSRYTNAGRHGERYGVPTRYDPSGGTDDTFSYSDNTISISTATSDDFGLHYRAGSLRWNANGHAQFDISRHNIDQFDGDSSDYVGSTSSSEFPLDNASGIYSIAATDVTPFEVSAVINVIAGVDSIMPEDTGIDDDDGDVGDTGDPKDDPKNNGTFDDTFKYRVAFDQEQYTGSPINIRAEVTDNPVGFPHKFVISLDDSKIPAGTDVRLESYADNQAALYVDSQIDVEGLVVVEAVQDGEPENATPFTVRWIIT